MPVILLAAVLATMPSGRPYDVQHYKIELTLQPDGTFNNTLTTTLVTTRATAELEFDAYGLAVSSTTVDGENATFKALYDKATLTGTLTVKPPHALPKGKSVIVSFVYTGKAGNAGYGFNAHAEPGVALPGYFTQFEPSGAQRFMPCNDQPRDKATSEVIATVDERYQVVSNGLKIVDEGVTVEGHPARRVHWKQDKPHSVYLIALAIAPFEEVVASTDFPSSTIWVPPGAAPRAHAAADAIGGLAKFQTSFVQTRYPWPKLDVVAMPNLYYGGMENTSVIFERTTALLVDHKNDQLARTRIVDLLAHEMAHQYFGNLVTCATWNDVWLNEGFATWLGGLTTDDYNGADNDEVELGDALDLHDDYFHQEASARAHALTSTSTSLEDGFDTITYTKGARVLKMLDVWLGRDEFRKGIKAYLETYAFNSVSSDDFFKAIAESAHQTKELKPFKDSWLTKKGYPVTFPQAVYADGKLKLTIRQQPSSTAERGPFVFKLPIVVHRASEPAFSKETTILVDRPEVQVTIEVPSAPQWINWNKNEGALTLINPTSVSEDQWVDGARRDPDPVWRFVSALNLLGSLAAREPRDDAKLSGPALAAIEDLLTKDPSPYVREAVLLELANTQVKKLPESFAGFLVSLAKKPMALNDDAVGAARVRRAALEALGRVETAEGHRYLIDELAKKDIDINYLSAFAAGVARVGTPDSLANLRAALVTQKTRGDFYYRRAVEALGSVPSPEVASDLREVVKASGSVADIFVPLTTRLARNRKLKFSRDYAEFVRDTVLDERVAEDIRAALLATLDDVTTESGKAALDEVAKKAVSERTRSAATQLRSRLK